MRSGAPLHPPKVLYDGCLMDDGIDQFVAVGDADISIGCPNQRSMANSSAMSALQMHPGIFSQFPPDLLNRFDELKVFCVADNKDLRTLPEELFQGTPSLERIDLNDVTFERLPSDLLKGLLQLEKISGLRLTSYPVGLFENLPNLKEHTFIATRENLNGDIFSGSTIEKLTLELESVRILNGSSLSGLGESLSSLKITGDALDTLSPEFLQPLTKLESFYLTVKNVTNLSKEAFTLVNDNLAEIIIENVNFVDSDTFKNMSGLVNLTLHNVDKIHPDAFGALQLKSLANLDLSNNRLFTLESSWFASMTALRTVRLDNNKITTTPDVLFDHKTHHKLETITLTGNPIICNCALATIVHFSEHASDLNVEGNCSAPEKFRGYPMGNLKVADICNFELWQVWRNSCLSGHNDRIIEAASKITMTLDMCMYECRNERSFLCRSIDFNSDIKTCYLSKHWSGNAPVGKCLYSGVDFWDRILAENLPDVNSQSCPVDPTEGAEHDMTTRWTLDAPELGKERAIPEAAGGNLVNKVWFQAGIWIMVAAIVVAAAVGVIYVRNDAKKRKMIVQSSTTLNQL
ncbi:unnamed protein product [Owenia fusiformis]|uniref:Apple domain-containing protein n=1 Tax=Owenia fusiformis TaxID=6347 RepID=A0A8S4NPI2_OWEFU|nr:unnamed protein product [Owenia fusiformis]